MYAKAYDKDIVTIGDLRRLSALHPRPEKGDEESPWAGVGKAIADALGPMRREIVQNRIRLRVLLEMMQARDEDFSEEFFRRFYEAVERDGDALWAQTFPVEGKEYETEFADWLKAQERRLRSLYGDERFDAIEGLRTAYVARMERKNAPASGSESGARDS